MSKTGRWILALLVLVAAAPLAMAQPPQDEEEVEMVVSDKALDDPDVKEGLTVGSAVALIGVCLGAGAVVVGGGYGIARIGAQCIESIARQPEAAGSMFAPMIIAAAMVEGATLFAIVVCLMGVLKV
jgi:F-type H+-transporting ATPase subunit c